jgi:hypothetical protein
MKERDLSRSEARIRIAAFAILSCLVAMPMPAVAASPKPPKTVCLHFASSGTNWLMATKAMGKGTTLNGKITLYTINAAASYGVPWYGSGYMEGNDLRANLATEVGSYSYRVDLHYDTVTTTGSSVLSYTEDNAASGGTIVDTVTTVDCATIMIAGAP